jgi:hypothetical protein
MDMIYNLKMEKYYNPQYWADLLGMLTFYDVVMGCGSIYEDATGEILVILPSDNNKLQCGCLGAAHFRLDKKNDKLIPDDHSFSEKFIAKKSIANSFQSTISTPFWADFFEKYPYKKPIRISNV